MAKGSSKEKQSPNIEERRDEHGVRHFRCVLCEDTDHPFYSTNPRSTGGHNRIYHTPGAAEQLYSPEARQKATETRQARAMIAKVEQAAVILDGILGRTQAEDQSERVAELEAQLADVQRRYDEANQRASDLEAKLALIREASGL